MNDERGVRLLTAGQAAREVGVSAEYLRCLAKEGRLLCEQTPYGRLYPEDAVFAFRDERKQKKLSRSSSVTA